MVDLGVGGFAEKGTQIIGSIVKGGVAVGIILIILAVIIGVALYIRYLRKFNVKVQILSLRGSGTFGEPIYKIINDAGGFIEDKDSKSRWFRLRNQKIDLPSPPLDALQLDANGNNYVKILQKSDTEYYFLLPDAINEKIIVRNGKNIPVSQVNMKVVEGDVSYWGQIRKRDNKKMFDMESLMMKLLPYIIPTLMFMLVIFMTYMITEHWGEFSTAAQALKDAAESLKQISTADVTTR